MEVLWCIAVDRCSYVVWYRHVHVYMQGGTEDCELQCEKSSVKKDQMWSG